MLRFTRPRLFEMRMGQMFVDFKLCSRDHKRSVAAEQVRVDPSQYHCTAPMRLLEALRSPSTRLPTGYFTETPVYVEPPKDAGCSVHSTQAPHVPKMIYRTLSSAKNGSGGAPTVGSFSKGGDASNTNAIRAGPLVMYITGQTKPVVVNIDFVSDDRFGMQNDGDCDIRLGLEAIEQCQLFNELRPGGLLSKQGLSTLKKQGMMQVGLTESPLARRTFTKMKYMFIDEIQRGQQLTEYVGANPRVGQSWRFSQHCKYFRVGLWREMTRKDEFVEGLHGHSSYQRSHQQSVPEVRFMAPSP